MRKMSLVVCVFISLLSFCSCSKKDDWKGKIEYLNGIQVVTNPDQGLWEPKANGKNIIFKEEVAIGALEGDKNKLFHQPTYVIADQDENIYVLDSGNYRIQKFDKNANYLLTIGGQGQGPGEILRSFTI